VNAPGYHVSDFWIMQTNIWTAQLLPIGTNPYQSPWYEWPLMLKSYWYQFTPDSNEQTVRGVLLIGNPVILYSGLAALAICFDQWLRAKSEAAFLILFATSDYGYFHGPFFRGSRPIFIILSRIHGPGLAIALVFSEPNVLTKWAGRKTLLAFLACAFVIFAGFFPCYLIGNTKDFLSTSSR